MHVICKLCQIYPGLECIYGQRLIRFLLQAYNKRLMCLLRILHALCAMSREVKQSCHTELPRQWPAFAPIPVVQGQSAMRTPELHSMLKRLPI